MTLTRARFCAHAEFTLPITINPIHTDTKAAPYNDAKSATDSNRILHCNDQFSSISS